MLVFSRKPGQSFQIGHDVFVQIVRINGGQVSLGITAPKHVPILRDNCIFHDPNYPAEMRSLDEAADTAIKETP